LIGNNSSTTVHISPKTYEVDEGFFLIGIVLTPASALLEKNTVPSPHFDTIFFQK